MQIRDIMPILLKRWVLIVFAILLFGLICGYYAYFISDDKYQSTAVMIINSNYADTSMAEDTENQVLVDQSYNKSLVKSYQALCQTKRILDQVINEAKLPMTAEKLSSLISVNSKEDTTLIDISATTTEPALSATIANGVADVFVKEVPQIMNMNNVQIIDPAEIPTQPINPNRLLIALLGLLIGLFMGVLIALATEYFDDSIKSGEQLEKLLDAPMIGAVPNLPERK